MTKINFLILFVVLSSVAHANSYFSPSSVTGMRSQRINGDTFYYSTNGKGEVSFNINVPSEGYYRVRAKVLAMDGNSDSFYVEVDERFPELWNIRQNSKVQYATWNNELFLSKGEHQINFLARETNTNISELLLTYKGAPKVVQSLDFANEKLNSNFLGDIGSDAINCDQGSFQNPCKWDRKELAKIKRDFITGKPVLEVSYPPVAIGTPRVTFNQKLPRDEEYTLSYRIKFGAHYRWAKGGKMHGLGSATPTTGCRERKDDEWSVRMLTASVGRLAIYVYDQDRNNPNGCGEGFVAPNFKISDFEKWYNISLYVKLNTPNEPNGVAKLFVDGKQIHEVKGLRLRKSGSSRSFIQKFMFNTFYGGGSWDAAPDRTTHVQFSNFQVTKGEVPRILTDTKVAADYSALSINKLLKDARNIKVPNARDKGVKKDFTKYYDTARANLDLETGVFSGWRFSNQQRYNGYFLRKYGELFLKIGQLYSETTGIKLPKVSFNFHSKNSGQIGFQIASSSFRAYHYNQDPNQIIKQFLVDLIQVSVFKNPSQRNAINSIKVSEQSLASSFSQLNHRAFRYKSSDMYLPQLLRRSANLFLLEEQHYKSNPISSNENLAQSSIDLRVDNFGRFQYEEAYSGHRQSGVRSIASVEEWDYSHPKRFNESLARAYGQYLIELHDIHRLSNWHGDPAVQVLTRSKEPTKAFKIGSKPWRSFKSNVHPRRVLQKMYYDY